VKRWNKTRKPKLAIDILAGIVLCGELSKSKAESVLKNHHYYHADILNAFRILEENEFIEASHSETGRGRPQRYYRITDEGFKALIDHDPKPEKFWKAVVGFCHHNDNQVSLHKVDEFYRFFMQRYLEYSAVHGYSFQLDNFNDACKNWIEERILKSDKITIDQKVLEALAFLEPPVTVDRLSKKIDESVIDIKEVLSKFTPIVHKPLAVPGEGFSKNLFRTHKIYDEKNWGDFLLHYSVVCKNDLKGNDFYELSLFGIILVLTLIRYNDMDKLKQGLCLKSITFQQYYDRIASNYKNKLPLIFGKWYLLKRILKEFCSYNFDTIIDKDTRLKSVDKLILAGGKRELYEGSKAVALHIHKQMSELQAKGLEILRNYMSNPHRYVLIDNKRNAVEKDNHQKIEAIRLKIFEITNLLNPLVYDPNSYVEMLTQGSNTWFDKHTAVQLSRFYEMDNIDRLFANEINSLYYLGLVNENDFKG
jgi:predicted transcriptional regulator